MNKKIIITEKAYRVFLYRIDEQSNGLFPGTPMNERSDAEFVSARDEWCASGICEMDFSGKLRFIGDMPRIMHNIKNRTAEIRFDSHEGYVLFLKGPVDSVEISVRNGMAAISRVRDLYVMEKLVDIVRNGRGELSVTSDRHCITRCGICEENKAAAKKAVALYFDARNKEAVADA